MAKRYNVLSVCGSGTVTSSMIADKLKEALEERGCTATTTETRPTEALQIVHGGDFDFIVFTSPLPEGDYGIPIINAIGFLTGFGEDEFLEELDKVLADLDSKQ